jgi:hypothetical protein
MLPNASRGIDTLREEAEFFTNQVYREVKRTFAIDYEMARGTTINLGEMLLRLTYQISNGWLDILSRYSNMNEDRRMEDERALLAAANKKLDELDIGFGEDMKDLPMFKEQTESETATENQQPSATPTGNYKGRYTVAYSKMDNQRLLQEPLLPQQSDTPKEEAKKNIFDEDE